MTRRKHLRSRATRTRARALAADAAVADAPSARGLFDPRAIKKLVGLMEESGLVELEIESASEKVRLVRADHREPAAPPASAGHGARPEVDDGARSAAVSERAITSPMVGTFHRAPAPGAQTFVEVGDVVERGQVLCLIEAMKMMNEIEAEFRGRVKQVLLENGTPVEFGEALFLIEPL